VFNNETNPDRASVTASAPGAVCLGIAMRVMTGALMVQRFAAARRGAADRRERGARAGRGAGASVPSVGVLVLAGLVLVGVR
jgi:hypothetical protein